MSRIPNLFLIGAKKSATSSLWEYIRTHPQIYSPEVKEPRFFYDNMWCRDLNEYLSLYKNAKDQAYLLDSSPQYSIDPNSRKVAERIFDFNPHSKIIYILRDPFDRMISDYVFLVWRRRETKDALDVLSTESIYLRTSYYAEQIKPYWELFGEKAIYIDTYEALISNPQGFCQRLFAWLNIDSNFIPGNLHEKLAVTPTEVRLFDESAWLVKIWRIVRRQKSFTKFAPRWLRLWGREFLTVRKLVDVKSQEFAREKQQIRQLWGAQLRKSITDLEDLCGKKFLEWPSRSWPHPVASEPNCESSEASRQELHQGTWSGSPGDSA